MQQSTNKGYFNYDMCKVCGGRCCNKQAGLYIPADFNQPITVEFILSLLDTGKFAMDWWEGDPIGGNLPIVYYLRPRHVDEPAIDGSYGGTCVNWSRESGCSLTEKERPFQCRKLMPNYNFQTNRPNCSTAPEDKASKKDCVIAWYEYQEIFRQVEIKYKNRKRKCNISEQF